MRRTLTQPALTLSLLTLIFLVGCGGMAPIPPPAHGPIPSPTPVIPSVLSALPGDWLTFGTPVTAAPPILATLISSFSGSISIAGATITGFFRAFSPDRPSGCPPLTTPIPFTGTLDAKNNLTLTAPLSGGIATITADLPQNLQAYTAGSYQVIGGTCAMPATTMKIAQFAPATGIYIGTLDAMDLTTNTAIPGTATTIMAMLTQSVLPGADGRFSLSGTVTATGACIGKLTFAKGTVSGGSIAVPYASLITPPVGVFNGTLSPRCRYPEGRIRPLFRLR